MSVIRSSRTYNLNLRMSLDRVHPSLKPIVNRLVYERISALIGAKRGSLVEHVLQKYIEDVVDAHSGRGPTIEEFATSMSFILDALRAQSSRREV